MTPQEAAQYAARYVHNHGGNWWDILNAGEAVGDAVEHGFNPPWRFEFWYIPAPSPTQATK